MCIVTCVVYNYVLAIYNLGECCFALLLQIGEANSCDALDSVVDEPQTISLFFSEYGRSSHD